MDPPTTPEAIDTSALAEELLAEQGPYLSASSEAQGDPAEMFSVDADAARLISERNGKGDNASRHDKRWPIVHISGENFGCFETDAFEQIAIKHRIIGERIREEDLGKKCCKAVVMFKPEEVCLMKDNGICDILKFADRDTSGSFLYTVKTPKNDKLMENARIRAISLKRKKLNEESGVLTKRKKHDETVVEVTEEEVLESLNFLKERCTKRNPDTYLVNDYFVHADFSDVIKITGRFERRNIVYSDLWKRGFMLTSGTKFGCDFLVYDGRPSEVHSDYMCHIMTESDVMTPTWIRTHTRLARAVKKQIMLAVVWSDNKVTYTRHADWDEGSTGKGKVKLVDQLIDAKTKPKTSYGRRDLKATEADSSTVGSSGPEKAPPQSWDDVIAAIDKYPKFNRYL